MRTAAVLLLPLLALASPPAVADVRIDYRVTEGDGASIQGFIIGHGRLRSDMGEENSVIFDPGSRSMIMLEHKARRFTRLGPEEMRQMGETLNQAMAEVERAMANVPPEMRAQMQGMLGQALGGLGGEPLVRIVDTGQRDRVAGHACTIYRTEVQGSTVSEACMGPASVLDGLSAAERRVLDGVMAMTRELMDSLARGPLASIAEMTPFRDDQIPLRVTEFDEGRRGTSEFAGISRESLPAELFEIPAGYREQKIEMPRFGR
jgi:hypothetical protein